MKTNLNIFFTTLFSQKNYFIPSAMNALRLSTKSIPRLGLTTRSFHTNRACLTGKTFETDTQGFEKSVIKADHPVIVDFYANWCGPCKMLTPILTKFVAQNPKVSLFKVDIDDNTDIGQKYKIAALPTVVAFQNGEVVDQFVGMRNKAQVEEFVKANSERAD
ncbi:unnamed protein product [Absidia cylindrospora]